MTCKDIKNMLTAYCERTLSEKEHARIESHLAGCSSCRRLAEGFSLLWKEAVTPERTGTSPYFMMRLEERLRENGRSVRIRKNTPGFVLRRVKPLAYAALLLFGVFYGYTLGTRYVETAALKEAARIPVYLRTFEDIPENSIADAYRWHYR
ncbi:zf-HC2 domain-containing protein [candidate division KSB1 bacterium]